MTPARLALLRRVSENGGAMQYRALSTSELGEAIDARRDGLLCDLDPHWPSPGTICLTPVGTRALIEVGTP